jgi:putative ABC transport system substrate-binding protein
MLEIRRREFITLLGGSAAWPLAASAQQGDRVRRIGVHMPNDENDPEGKLRLSAFTQALADLGWTDGRNVRMDVRWGGGDTDRMRALAQELVGLQPDIILTGGTAATAAVQRETRTIPIVFANANSSLCSASRRLGRSRPALNSERRRWSAMSAPVVTPRKRGSARSAKV